MTAARPMSERQALRLHRPLWRRFLRLCGQRTFIREGTSGDVTVVAIGGAVRPILVERLEQLGFREEGRA